MTWLRSLFCVYLLFLVWAEGTVTNPADPDLWHRLALGEKLWATGHFPAPDTFSYLSDYSSVADHEWGSAILFYACYVAAGTSAFIGVKLVTLALTILLLAWAGLRDHRPTLLLAAFYALVLLTLLPSFQSTVRCMTFTHIFLALWIYWFQCERHGRPIWTGWYVLTMMVWSNLHGGFAIGLLWLGLILLASLAFGSPSGPVGQRERPSRKPAHPFPSPRPAALRLGLCLIATLVNPFGLELWVATLRALTTTRQSFGEWAPVSWADVGTYPGYKLLLILLAVLLAIQLYRRGWSRIDRPVVFLIGCFMALSLTSARHTSLLAVVAGALAPGLFPEGPPLRKRDEPLYEIGYMAFRVTFLLIPFYAALQVLPGAGLRLEYPSISCPVAAVDYLKTRGIQGKLLVPFNYGSYALWELRGQMRVSMDGRYDLVYRPSTYQRVSDFFSGVSGWENLLVDPAPQAVLLPLTDSVYPKLKARSNWTEAWHDSTNAIFLPLHNP